MNEMLFEKWSAISRENSAYTRIDSNHPFEWYFGYDEVNSKSLLLISEVQPPEYKSTKNIRLKIGKREDNKWAFTISLLNENYKDVYLNLCSDLIDSSRNKKGSAGLKFIFNRYNQWLKLMESANRDRLSESEVKGLIGELIVLKKLLKSSSDYVVILNNWMGPEGSDQDFIFENYWIEVKSIGRATNEIKISSLEQLRDDLDGILTIVNIDKSSPENSESITLASVFENVKQTIHSDEDALDIFLSKLKFNGFSKLETYSEEHYEIGEISSYQVNQRFPKISRNLVTAHVINANYIISRNSIFEWKIELE